MFTSRVFFALALACVSFGFGAEQSEISKNEAIAESTANPIRRVVTMLQGMTKKIEAESKKEEALYDKYMCYCKNSGSTLQASIDAASSKIPQVESSLKEAKSSKLQLEQELKDHQSSRADAKASMAKATSIREKEAAEYSKEKSESDTNIEALGNAISAIEKGMTGFVQTRTGEMLKRLTLASDLSNFDRQMVMAFLSGKASEGYVPQSGQITGILKQMEDTMVKDRDELVSTEKAALASYNELMSAKTKEVAANTKAIEAKSKRVGELGVEIAELKNDLDDTSAALLEDKKFLANMDATCSSKAAEWSKIQKARGEELVAISETIKILNDDEALELFKKTLPTPSFMQEATTSNKVRSKAMNIVQELRRKSPKQLNRVPLDLISLALSGKKVGFGKVIKLIDNMVSILGKEQADDDMKKEYCEKQFDAADDKKKGLQQDLKDLEATIDDSTETVSTLKEEIKALSKAIKALDKDVADSTETRKEEHEDYKELIASDSAAKELLAIAKNRLNKYYNPKMYKPPPKRELSEEDRATLAAGGTLAPTAAPGGIAGTGVTVLADVREHRNQEAPPPPPDSFKAYAKKSEESTGVITMLDMLVADLDKEMTEAETAEKEAQKEYEAFMGDAAEKRAQDSKAVTDKEGYKAEAESDLDTAKEGKTGKVKDLMATEKYISGLHAECDWLMSNFQVRKEARTAEIESLQNAKSVLAGADYSFMQQGDRTSRNLRGKA